MKALIVYTHPNPRSFNHAILETVEADLKGRGVEVRVSDLYAKRFDPALSPRDFESFAAGRLPQDICDEQNDVTWADLLVFIYPIWWYERPALLKGWFDRVFSIGFAYKPSDKGIVGLLKGKRGLVFSTAGAFEEESVQSGMIAEVGRYRPGGVPELLRHPLDDRGGAQGLARRRAAAARGGAELASRSAGAERALRLTPSRPRRGRIGDALPYGVPPSAGG